MKLFKKAKELLGRIAGNHDTPPGPRPEPTPKADILPEFFDTRPQYQRDQAEFKARAKAVTVVWDSSRDTDRHRGVNAAKRKGWAVMISRGASPRVAKRKQRDGIEFDAVAA